MFLIYDTEKSFAQASFALEEEVIKEGFGVLHVHDLGNTLRLKGQDFKEECRVFEVCNPSAAFEVLKINLNLNMALPCRISVFTKNGNTKVGMLEPVKLLTVLSDDKDLQKIANHVQELLIEAIKNSLK